MTAPLDLDLVKQVYEDAFSRRAHGIAARCHEAGLLAVYRAGKKGGAASRAAAVRHQPTEGETVNITDIIKPVTLLSGSHADTGKTGQGCFMNVIAYLNGEPQITDKSECVCFVVRPIAIWLNDFLYDDERERMIPYIGRAMGSRSDDKAVFVPRAEAAARFAKRCSEIAQESAASVARAAMAASAARAASAASVASVASVAMAAMAAMAARAAMAASAARAASAASVASVASVASAESAYEYKQRRQQIIEAAFAFLDEALPKAVEHPPVVQDRAQKLAALA